MSMFHTSPTRTDAIDAFLGAPFMEAGAEKGRWTCDPLEPDAVEDEMIVTTSRRLLRLTIAAADAGARFALHEPERDAAAWMLTPGAIFDGLPAIDACQDLRHFGRSIVLHGLGLGLDADPIAVDELLAEEEEEAPMYPDDGAVIDTCVSDPLHVRLKRPLLLTCWIDCCRASTRLFAFCGVVTDRPHILIDKVMGLYGAEAAATADFHVGFDQSTAMATAMISEAMALTLRLAADDPESPLARGLDVAVEQRFAA